MQDVLFELNTVSDVVGLALSELLCTTVYNCAVGSDHWVTFDIVTGRVELGM